MWKWTLLEKIVSLCGRGPRDPPAGPDRGRAGGRPPRPCASGKPLIPARAICRGVSVGRETGPCGIVSLVSSEGPRLCEKNKEMRSWRERTATVTSPPASPLRSWRPFSLSLSLGFPAPSPEEKPREEQQLAGGALGIHDLPPRSKLESASSGVGGGSGAARGARYRAGSHAARPPPPGWAPFVVGARGPGQGFRRLSWLGTDEPVSPYKAHCVNHGVCGHIYTAFTVA
jgi:hypothetical protein